ncbi:LPXTG cell wall anchor domain-containing protein [uncultured Faecalicoccus sp.]|uniref:LPXTG cell wall anchor domain-containing protein n=1 Tax=uncultured Faecalicoccus sp. TaxID=1971760 RepID=UPI00260A9A15|nr:LPXTG cell wall anchor domain-containing protein [uncultured Faecalicoccus sp.]
MNLVKKLLASACAFTVACMPMTTVFAAGSIVANGAPTGEIAVDGKIVEGSTAQFSDTFTVEDQEVLDAIAQLNSGAKLADVLDEVEMPEGVEIDLADFSLLTKIQDLSATDAEGNDLSENVTVGWEVPNLTEDMNEVYVLHYSEKNAGWEVIEPDKVDKEAKEITATFEDLSPVGVIYKSEGAVDTSTGTNTVLYIAIGAIALVGICGIVVAKRKFN